MRSGGVCWAEAAALGKISHVRLFGRRPRPAPRQVRDRWAHLPEPPIPPDLLRDKPEDLPPHGLARAVWSDEDFPTMGWHDATLWAFQVQHADPFDEDTNPDPQDRAILDLDYITRWVDPEPGTRHFQFWVAPCTLVFLGVTELELRSSVLLEDERPRSLQTSTP